MTASVIMVALMLAWDRSKRWVPWRKPPERMLGPKMRTILPRMEPVMEVLADSKSPSLRLRRAV